MMRRLREQQAGFAMIEAVVAAVLLVIVSLGVLLGLDAASRSSGREKSRSVAAALTEQDQERLRSFRAVDLDNYDETRTVVVNKVPYKIQSQADWVRDSTGGTESCNSNATQADYMRVTSTTTSGLINAPIAPIKMSSLVAPPIGAFGTNQGTLGIQVNNRDGAGVEGLLVTITGPTTQTNPTNSAGCAIFAYVPVGSYSAGVTKTNWVDKGGNATATTGATVASGTVSVKTLAYDNQASVVATFDTEPRTGGAPIPASSTQLGLSNGGVPAGPFSPFGGLRVVDPPGGAALSITAPALFPFADGYGVYGGGCPGADPTKYISNYYTLNPSDFIDTDPGLASPPVVVRLPSINLRVMYGSSGIPLTSLPRITATSKSTNCSEKFTFTATTLAPTTDLQGYMLTPALPFGDYDVCVDAIKPSTTTRITKTLSGTSVVKNRFAEGIKTPSTSTGSPVIDLNSGATTGTCP